jgi:hypothetical protein
VRRALAAALAVGAATVLATGAATASYADSPLLHMSFDEEPVSTVIGGLGPGCPAFTGTLVENRHLEITGFFRDGGAAYARTFVSATVTLTPADAGDPSYTGSYVSRQTGAFADYGESDRQVTTTTHGRIEGSDGSSYGLDAVVHFSVDGNGVVRAWVDDFHCD